MPETEIHKPSSYHLTQPLKPASENRKNNERKENDKVIKVSFSQIIQRISGHCMSASVFLMLRLEKN